MDLSTVTCSQSLHFYRLLAFGLSLVALPLPWILRIGLALVFSLFGLSGCHNLLAALSVLNEAVPFAVLGRELVCGFLFGTAFCALIFAAQFTARALNEVFWRKTVPPLSRSSVEIALSLVFCLLLFEPQVFLAPFLQLLFHQPDLSAAFFKQVISLGGVTLQFAALVCLPFFAVFFCLQALTIGMQRLLSSEVDHELLWSVSIPTCVLILMLSLQPLLLFARAESGLILQVLGAPHE